MSYTKGIITS